MQVHARIGEFVIEQQRDILWLSVTDDRVRESVRAAVDAALSSGRTAPQVTVLVSGASLPAPVVAALVAGLRRLREVGGAMIVVPQTPAVRDGLMLHGLDRVFALPIGNDVDAPSRRNRWQPGRAVATVLTAMMLAFALGARADAQTDGVANDAKLILERVIARNPELTTYQGRMHVDVKLLSFPYFRQHLDATTYYKRPSNYEVIFDRLPSYARGFEKLYTDIGDPSDWARHFTITFEGETPFGGRSDLTLRMVQRVRGMIDHETVLIDPEQFTIDQIRYDYYNGGHIMMSQEFRPVGSYLLLAAQSADIMIPHVHAVAKGRYDGYQTNVALDDTVFSRKDQ